MIEETVVRQWSNAFFLLVKETDQIKHYKEEGEVLINLFAQYNAFLPIVNSSNLDLKTKTKIIKETFGDFSLYTINFLLLLVEKGYFNYTRLILKEFRKLCNAYYGVEYGVVYSVIPLTAEQMKEIKNKISNLINSQDLELVNQIDQTLIGGIKVKVKNQVFDNSIQGKIAQLKTELWKNKQE